MTVAGTQRIMNVVQKIPDENENQVYDILVTFIKQNISHKKRHNAKGALKKYADSSKWPLEEGAFEKAVVEKHETD